MENVVLVIHLFLALTIVGLILLQRSEGGGLGIGSGGGGLGGFASARSTANILSRATGICAFAFFGTSLFLGILAGSHSKEREGILDSLAETPPVIEEIEKQAPDSITIKEDGSAAPSEPSAPIAE